MWFDWFHSGKWRVPSWLLKGLAAVNKAPQNCIASVNSEGPTWCQKWSEWKGSPSLVNSSEPSQRGLHLEEKSGSLVCQKEQLILKYPTTERDTLFWLFSVKRTSSFPAKSKWPSLSNCSSVKRTSSFKFGWCFQSRGQKRVVIFCANPNIEFV